VTTVGEDVHDEAVPRAIDDVGYEIAR